MCNRKMSTVGYFLDETFEELYYDITTTVGEAVEQLAGHIKLQNYTTFTLYEMRLVLFCTADLKSDTALRGTSWESKSSSAQDPIL